ncbi:lipase maturation factor 2-like [Aethina tumida]|uniref:lipase maturation factor 2-like n=1 Tax=Aethina tumida TaxID=116153 RepID=UPI002148F8E9|nr:lipase maturation factor 2-like [Aethina tumida]
MISLRYTRNLFLRCFCVVYLFAFISFYIQIPGLYGDNGVLPASSLLENSKHKTLSAKVHYQPTLLWLAPYLGLNINYALDVLALLGSFLAFSGFVSQKFCTIPLFAALWSLYFSLYQIGQTFVANHYDDLLLEAGFLALLVAPMLPGKRKGSKGSPCDLISFWLVKWLLFRFLLSSGLSKLLSGCPKWWSLTAFDYWFQSLPLPSPLSWYVHYLPSWILKLVGVFANVSEIGLPFLFFLPIRSVRITGFVFQIFLQMCIVLTGNFNFVNLLIVTLLFSLLDDLFFFGRRKSLSKLNILGKIANVIVHGAVIYGVILLYNLKVNGTTIDSNIAFTKTQFDQVVSRGLTYTTYFGIASLGLTVIQAFGQILFDSQASGSKVLNSLTAVLYGGLATLLFFSSTVPLASLHSSSNSTVHPQVRTIYNRLHKLHAVNQYGLFTKMTGVDGRQEIILEGSDNIDGPWKELNFLYKPGNVNHSLPFVAPYSPRLDWQMHWAAFNTYEKEPWVLSLTHRILLGQPEVLSLLDRNHSPFVKNPPKYIRAALYKYKYTPWNQRSQSAWWTRVKVGEYFPPYSSSSNALIDYLRARNLLPAKSKQTVNPLWKQLLDSVRYVTSHLEATLLLWSVFTAGCALITTSGKK